MVRLRDDDEPLPPPPQRADDFDTQLAWLEEWAAFRNTDGFVHFHHVDSGQIELSCGEHANPAYEILTPEQRHARDEDLLNEGDFPEAAWAAEFSAGMCGGDCQLPVRSFEHFVGYGLTLREAVDACYEAVRTGRPHECRREERRAARKRAVRKAEELFAAGKLSSDEFPDRETAILRAADGHWRFQDKRDMPSLEQISALLLAEHPDVKEIVDLRPEDERG